MNFSFQNRMFLAKVTGKSVNPVIYYSMSYFWTLLTLVYDQVIFVYIPFPCIFATNARMNLILLPMDSRSSLTIRHINKQNPSQGYVIMTSYVTCEGENQLIMHLVIWEFGNFNFCICNELCTVLWIQVPLLLCLSLFPVQISRCQLFDKNM